MSEGAGSGAALTFPDQPRLALDQLLAQLVERAGEVMATQGRLRGLLAANQLIVADLALPAVLRHIAEAARELIGARYAALGVIAPGGGLAEFIHVGMPDEVIAEIGHLPEGKGCWGRSSPSRTPSGSRRSATILAPPASRRPSSDVQLPRGADPGARGDLRQPLPGREHARGFSAEDEELAHGAGGDRRGRHRERPALRGGEVTAASGCGIGRHHP